MNVDNSAFQRRSSADHAAMEFHSKCVHVLHEVRIKPMGSEVLYAVVVLKSPYIGLFCAAQSGGRVHESLEYFLKIEGRAADDLEDVGSGGLLLERFAQFIEQACVLDGNHRLVGEGGHQFDLLVGKGLNLEAVQHHHADRLALSQQWDPEGGAKAGRFLSFDEIELPIGQNIVNLNGL